MEILKSGHQYYDGFFTNFFGWILLEEIMSYPPITLYVGAGNLNLSSFSAPGFHPSECRAPTWGWPEPEPENHRDSGSDISGALGSCMDQSISSVTQLTWAQRLPTRHSDASREEVVCDISAKTVIIHSPSELRGFDREKVLPLIFSVGKFKIYLNIHYCNSEVGK